MEIDRRALEMIFRTNGERLREYPFPANWYPRKIPNAPVGVTWNGQTSSDSFDFKTVDDVFTSEIREALDDYHDQNIGVMLSGGIDSALLLYLVKREYPNSKITAYHTDWGDSFKVGKEIDGAQHSAKFVDVPLRVIDGSTKAQIPFIEDALRNTLSANYSSTLFYMAFNFMKKEGVDLAITGDGVDSFFGGHRFHKVYYRHSKYGFIPFLQKMLRYEPYIMMSKLWGSNRAWFASMISREPEELVNNSNFSFSYLYDKVKGDTLWDLIQNWGATNISYDASVAMRGAWSNDIEIKFPFIRQSLLDLAGTFSPKMHANKNIIRKYMLSLGFPKVIVEAGFHWNKMGWGGASSPYFKKNYMEKLKPMKAEPEYWFTSRGAKIYSDALRTKSSIGLLMTLFLKILELVEEP